MERVAVLFGILFSVVLLLGCSSTEEERPTVLAGES